MGGVAIALLITVIGVRVLPFAPDDDARPAYPAPAGSRLMANPRNPRRVLVSATHKSSGKTTVAIGLCRALRDRGLTVQAFKKGPDYIDPMWLTAATGRRCRNLDPYLSEAAEYRGVFRRHAAAADICIVEGNKGLYDGLALDGSNSNAALAKSLGLPVVLVIDARGMTRGIAPLILGYQAFDRDVKFAGVILNNLGGSRHEAKLRMVIEHYTDLSVLGALHCDPRLAITERYLGLTPSNEAEGAEQRVAAIGALVGAAVDIDEVLRIAADVPPLGVPGDAIAEPFPAAAEADLRIGVIQDRAFGFYYADDLDALRAAGATLVRIDALADAQLPNVDALFIGGGFPELFAAELEANAPLRTKIRSAIDAGLPVYAECGGLMYLARTLTHKGQTYRDGRCDSRRRRDARPARRAGLRQSRGVRGLPVAPGRGAGSPGARARIPLFEPREPARRPALRLHGQARPRRRRASRRHRRAQRARVVCPPAQRGRQCMGGAVRRLRPAGRLPPPAAGQHRLPAAGARAGSDGHLTTDRRAIVMISTHGLNHCIEVGDRRVETDSEGYLVDRAQWSEDFARELARREGLALTPAHWEVILFLRDHYLEHGVQAQVRVMIRHFTALWGAQRGSNHYLHEMFPRGGPQKQGNRLAGLLRTKGEH